MKSLVPVLFACAPTAQAHFSLERQAAPAGSRYKADHDAFVVVTRLPKEAGTLYRPVRQRCEQGRSDCLEVPQPGQKLHDLKSPAAWLEVLPAAGGGHKH